MDLVAIRAYPPALRWFSYDPADEAFLRAEVYAVFDSPVSSEAHRDAFLERCTRRAERLARHGDRSQAPRRRGLTL